VKTAQYLVDKGSELADNTDTSAKIWPQNIPAETVESDQIVPQAPSHPRLPENISAPEQSGRSSKRRSRDKSPASFFKSGLPWLPDQSHGGVLRRCFVLFEDPSASICGKMTAVLVMSIICLSTVSFMMESMPDYRETPPQCAEDRESGLQPTVEACEPQPSPVFARLEMVCIIIFSIEYLCRVLTVHATAASTNVVEVLEIEDQCTSPRSLAGTETSGWKVTLNYAKKPLNVIDFMAILPWYIELMIGGGGGGGKMAVIRVLRLARVFRIFKMGKSSSGMQMLGEVLLMSRPALLLLMFFNCIIMIVFGSLLYHVEGAKYSVAPQFTQPDVDECGGVMDAPHPFGVYVRSSGPGSDSYEATPYRNIPVAMWWVATTMTTVGYGDISPTTELGKAIGVACFYTGIIMLALPIAVLGANFEMVYKRHTQKKEAKRLSSKDSNGSDSSKSSQASRESLQSNDSDPKPPWLPKDPGVRKKIFLLFEAAGASKLGRAISLVVMAAILISTWSFVLESMDGFSKIPDTCSPDNLTVEDCEPRPHEAFKHIDVACIIVFTIDYLCRLLTVHTAEPRECGIRADLSESHYKGLRITRLYALQKMNLLDFCAIAPFYVELAQGGAGGSGGFAVLRVLRLIRIFRVLRMKQLRSGVEMLLCVLADSFPALSFLFFMSMLTCVLFSSCMFFAEGTWFSVEHYREEYPNGLYVRPTIDGHGIEPSPFRSIPYAFWWFFQTATTVGYGDLAPTTTAGRFIGISSFYAGMILLALPVTILGGNFTKHYFNWTKDLDGAEKAITNMEEVILQKLATKQMDPKSVELG
jgi:hypothetical protein